MKARARLAWLGCLGAAAIAAAASAGCGDDDPAAPPPDAIAADGGDVATSSSADAAGELTERACRLLMEAYFARYRECVGDADVDRYLFLCPEFFFSPGSTTTPEALVQCAAAQKHRSCDDIARGHLTAPCAPPGTRRSESPARSLLNARAWRAPPYGVRAASAPESSPTVRRARKRTSPRCARPAPTASKASVGRSTHRSISPLGARVRAPTAALVRSGPRASPSRLTPRRARAWCNQGRDARVSTTSVALFRHAPTR